MRAPPGSRKPADHGIRRTPMRGVTTRPPSDPENPKTPTSSARLAAVGSDSRREEWAQTDELCGGGRSLQNQPRIPFREHRPFTYPSLAYVHLALGEDVPRRPARP